MTQTPTTITGERVHAYRALVIAQGLELYTKTKLQPNGFWTPKAMMKAAKEILGPKGAKLRARDYEGAAKALRELIGMPKTHKVEPLK
jgi:O-glycosyl hydrolase